MRSEDGARLISCLEDESAVTVAIMLYLMFSVHQAFV